VLPANGIAKDSGIRGSVVAFLQGIIVSGEAVKVKPEIYQI
jgi:hypothetical protein